MLFKLMLLALLVPAALFAACGDDDDDAVDDDLPAASTPAGDDDDGGGDGGGEPQAVAIDAEGFAFLPAEVSVSDGATVTVVFRNADDATHSITIGDVDVVVADGGEEVEGTFTASSDTAEFHCKFHPAMTGVIAVEDASTREIGTDPPPTAAGGGGISGGY